MCLYVCIGVRDGRGHVLRASAPGELHARVAVSCQVSDPLATRRSFTLLSRPLLVSQMWRSVLRRYKHRNILSLVAISNDGPRPCLVYEYMENGSLADCLLTNVRVWSRAWSEMTGCFPLFLYVQHSVNLSWRLRMDIANQIADALHFLHTVNHPNSLIHGDVKRFAV